MVGNMGPARSRVLRPALPPPALPHLVSSHAMLTPAPPSSKRLQSKLSARTTEVLDLKKKLAAASDAELATVLDLKKKLAASDAELAAVNIMFTNKLTGITAQATAAEVRGWLALGRRRGQEGGVGFREHGNPLPCCRPDVSAAAAAAHGPPPPCPPAAHPPTQAAAKAEVASATKQAAALKKQVQALGVRLADLEGQRDVLRAQHATAVGWWASFRAKCAAERTCTKFALHDVCRLRDANAGLEASQAVAVAQLAATKQQLAAAQEQLAVTTTQLEQVIGDRDAAQGRLAAAQQQLGRECFSVNELVVRAVRGFCGGAQGNGAREAAARIHRVTFC